MQSEARENRRGDRCIVRIAIVEGDRQRARGQATLSHALNAARQRNDGKRVLDPGHRAVELRRAGLPRQQFVLYFEHAVIDQYGKPTPGGNCQRQPHQGRRETHRGTASSEGCVEG